MLDHSDVVFIALNHDVAADVLTALQFRPDHIIISLMAGCDMDALARLVFSCERITIRQYRHLIEMNFGENCR